LKHTSCEELKLTGGETIEFSPPEMLEFIKKIQKYATFPPRTYWCEFPFYIIIHNFKQQYCLGYRPEDLSYIETIRKRTWNSHKAHIKRLEQFPLEKAECYVRLKKSHGITTVRGLSAITGEDWSCIARVLRILELPDQIKDFLKSNKNDPDILKFFSLRKLIDIVRQNEEKLQVARFRELMGEFEEWQTIHNNLTC